MAETELDKLPTAPIDADSSDDFRIQDELRDGRSTAVARDAAGRIAYPSILPPDVESPLSLRTTASDAGPEAPKAPDPGAGSHRVHSESFLGVPTGEPGGAATSTPQRDRPSIAGKKKFVSDLPRKGRQTSALPLMRRAGTNVSMLNRAIREGNENGVESDSSSSSEDEEDVVGEGKPPARRRRPSHDPFRRFQVGNESYRTKGKVDKRDGRLNITVNDTSNTGYLANALGAAVTGGLPKKGAHGDAVRPTPSRLSSATTATSEKAKRPRLNIVIMVIGSRGDAQPFLRIGKILKEEYGHRVRIATHPAFRDFVEKDSGLDFFSVGGDPSELMAFMVKNPGMIPKLETVKAGDIGRRRAAMAEMFEGFWRACINATDNETDTHNLKMMGSKSPFIADAIIANPPSFAHIHCAEALGIPLHLMFTFPYTPTQAFPHPLASIKKSNVDPGYTNFISYPLVEMMVWQGLGDLVNNFRIKTLGLDPVSTLWAPGSTYRLHVPFTYMWSPGLVPKPADWGEEIDVSGAVFLDLASSFKPPENLVEFLDGGEPPIYIGFGSIVVDDAHQFTEMIFEAVALAGVRALVSRGWGGLGGENVPENVFMLENTPHDWLFPRVRAAVIHGGAGTTAMALKCGIPTMIVPFFGDQHFWGSMVASAGAGPEPVPYKSLNAEKLAEGIKFCLTDEARHAVQSIAAGIEAEGDGAKNAVKSFHRHLPLHGKHGEPNMRCSMLPDRVAVWYVTKTSLKLSAIAADILVEKGYLKWNRLEVLRHKEWNDFEGPGEPVSGFAGSLMGTTRDFFGGLGSVPYRIVKTSHQRAERKKKKEAKRLKKLQQNQKAQQSTSAAKSSAGFPFPEAGSNAQGQQPGAETRQPSDAARIPDDKSLVADTPGTDPPTAPAATEYVHDVSEGLGRSGRALAHAPIDLSLAIAQGFHNAPRLYGDSTVRRPVRVTGIVTGLKAARHEFVYGIYDGVTGVVKLPIRGAKENGVRGALAGVGMGLGGFVLKDLSAIISPFGYTLKGISKQIERGSETAKYIRRARIVQAQREMEELSENERKALAAEVYKGWDVMRQLSDLIMRENSRRGITRFLEYGGAKYLQSGKQLGRFGRAPAFESVEAAEKAIAAVQRGGNADDALGIKSFDIKRKSTEARKSADHRRKSEEQMKKQRPTRKETMEEQEVDDEANRNAARAIAEDVRAHALPPLRQDTAPLEVGDSH